MPFLRSQATASSRLPRVSARAALQSIQPAPVSSRNCFTCGAEMEAWVSRVTGVTTSPGPGCKTTGRVYRSRPAGTCRDHSWGTATGGFLRPTLVRAFFEDFAFRQFRHDAGPQVRGQYLAGVVDFGHFLQLFRRAGVLGLGRGGPRLLGLGGFELGLLEHGAAFEHGVGDFG